MAAERPTTGCKRPRSIFRNLMGSPNFAIVNFLSSDGGKTEEQEIVPIKWVKNGVKAQCYWPNTDLTRRQLDHLVASEQKPNDLEFDLHPIRILYSGCTLEEAKDKFDQLATKSGGESVQSKHTDSNGDDNSDASSDKEERSVKKRQKVKQTSKNKKSEKNINKGPCADMFEFMPSNLDINDKNRLKVNTANSLIRVSKNTNPQISDHQSNYDASIFSDPDFEEINEPINNSGRKTNAAQPVSTKKSSSSSHTNSASRCGSASNHVSLSKTCESANKLNHSFTSREKNTISKNLFNSPCSDSQDYVTHGEFEVFETKLFKKLNIIQQMIADNNSRPSTAPARELIKFPTSISDHVNIPAMDIKSLEELDSILQDNFVLNEMATYLSQLGGRKVSDFLNRALPKVVSDDVCFVTNWSGSEIPPGSLDVHGNLITREYKKTFANLTNLVETYCCASRMVCAGTTNKYVECHIQKWLLAYKDRVTPRKHTAKASNSNETTKKSPRKKKHA